MKKLRLSLWPKSSYDGMDKNLALINQNWMHRKSMGLQKASRNHSFHLHKSRINTATHPLVTQHKSLFCGHKRGEILFLQVTVQTKQNCNSKMCQKDLENTAVSPNRRTVSSFPLYLIGTKSNPQQFKTI